LINPELHKQPVALDREKHRNLKVRTELSNLQAAAGLNAFFLTAAEFADACKEYPILFLGAGKDEQGQEQVAPVAVFGVTQGENLFLKADGRWDAFYIPAVLRAYPFTMARIEEDRYAVCFDGAWSGMSETEGKPLFDDKGEPTPLLNDVRQFVEQLEVEIERTRLAGQRLMALKLLAPKRFEATLPNGEPMSVDGFFAVDEERLNALTDAEILELHRNGLMGLLQAHQISMGNMRRLLDRRLAAQAAVAANA
jgi:hypothetical protein